MRRPLLLLCSVFALGLAASALVACAGTKDGIPTSDAASLNKELADVQAFVERGDCQGLDGQLRQVQEGIDNLPSSVDAALVRNLNDGLDRLRGQSVDDCNADTTTETTATTETTPTVETVPQTTTATTPQTTTATAPQTPTTPPTTPPDPTPDPAEPGGVTPPTDAPSPGGAGVGEGGATEIVP